MEKPLIAIIGAGLMGHGIAQVFAHHAHPVRVYDTSADALATLRDKVRGNLTSLGADPSAADLIEPSSDLASAVRDASVVIEAGPEDLDLKRQLFREVEQAAPKEALLASNTSVIPITKIMEGLQRQDRTLGTHWWNPPYLVPLVEVIQTQYTSPDVIQAMTDLLRSVSKTPVHVKKDVPGFIGNRLQHAMWREAIALVERGICDAETVDTVVKTSFGLRLAVLGPLENADLVGTDLTLAVHEHVLPDLDARSGPSPYLKELVRDGRLGMKVGSGFQDWDHERIAALKTRLERHLMTLTTPNGQLEQ
jgi:3-hydroxybutyryl-CoA dehydrogenase